MSQKAIAYFRTSSAASVGGDKDSLTRQQLAVHSYAAREHIEVVAEFYDAGVSGKDELEQRPGFSAMLDKIETNGVRVIIVEEVGRFARETLSGLLGVMLLKRRGVTVYDAQGRDLTNPTDPLDHAMMEIGLVFASLERRRLVAKLKGARDRKRATGVKVEGRPSHAELSPALLRETKRLYRKSPRTGKRRSLAKISAELFEQGYMTAKGKAFSSSQIKRLAETG